MNVTTLPIYKVRQQLGKLVEEAYYLNRLLTITRSKRPMATLVSHKLFAQMIKFIEKHNHGLTDTLAIMTNPELQAILAEDDNNPKTAVAFDEKLLD